MDKMKEAGKAGGDPTLPALSMGKLKTVSTGGIMDFPGTKAKFPTQGAKESLDPEQQQNETNEGFGGR